MSYLLVSYVSRFYLVRQIRVGECWAIKPTFVIDKKKRDY